MEIILNKLGYVKGQPIQFLSKRICGLWLIWVSAVIFVGMILGGTQLINIPVFDAGYFLGFLLILGNKRLYRRLAYGSPSKFQKKIAFISVIFMFILMVGIGGHFFATQNYRMIWLSAFLAIGIHFVPFSVVHGKIMLPLAVLISINAVTGMLLPSANFDIFGCIGVAIMVFFGAIMLFVTKRPLNE